MQGISRLAEELLASQAGICNYLKGNVYRTDSCTAAVHICASPLVANVRTFISHRPCNTAL
jgi:hypothetical protein